QNGLYSSATVHPVGLVASKPSSKPPFTTGRAIWPDAIPGNNASTQSPKCTSFREYSIMVLRITVLEGMVLCFDEGSELSRTIVQTGVRRRIASWWKQEFVESQRIPSTCGSRVLRQKGYHLRETKRACSARSAIRMTHSPSRCI